MCESSTISMQSALSEKEVYITGLLQFRDWQLGLLESPEYRLFVGRS